MQIAQIVPKVRTQREAIFDYAIPPELLPQIKIGVLVEVPFHGRKIEGIVIDIKRSSSIPNLKKISLIIDPEPVIDKLHLELAKWMSDYYLAPLGKTLFENIVPPAKRTIKKLSDKKFKAPLISSKINKNKFLLISDFSKRLDFYIEAIKKTIDRHQAVIIILPDLSLISFFTKHFKNPVSILHSGLTRTQRWLEFDKIRDSEVKIVIGSNSALFAPLSNIGLIIVDQEDNETYKNDRSPRFHLVKVAQKLSQLASANLVLGTVSPRIETYDEALKGQFKILKNLKPKTKISIIDMNGEKQSISVPLQNKIDEMLAQRKKVLLVLNRKGEGTKFSCQDCGWISRCEKCGLPLIPQKAEAVCFRCELQNQLPDSCPRCQSIQIKPMGLGTARLKKFASDLWPQTKIIQIEKKLDGQPLRQNWDIAITTAYALKFQFPPIGLVGLIDADHGLNFPDFHSAEKTFQNFFKFLKIGEWGIIQTHLPENYVISDLAKMDYDKFFLDELENRKKSNFPPFVSLIRLLYKDSDESVARQKSQRVYNFLISHYSSQMTILGPSPAFIKKERGRYRYQIILKLKKRSKILDDFLWTLPGEWIIDVDPISLL